ncbi:unnamed protein product [Ectocarpus sp. 6 AP-2014]
MILAETSHVITFEEPAAGAKRRHIYLHQDREVLEHPTALGISFVQTANAQVDTNVGRATSSSICSSFFEVSLVPIRPQPTLLVARCQQNAPLETRDWKYCRSRPRRRHNNTSET